MFLMRSTFTVAAFLTTVTFCSQVHVTNAFYVPGVHATQFEEGDEVPLKVNAMKSIHTQIPRDYYKLPFCEPEGGPKMASESFGEFLTGNKIQSSPFHINMKKDQYCQILCQNTPTPKEAEALRKHILYDYHNNWIVDNLPSAHLRGKNNEGNDQHHYAGGFPIGFHVPVKKTGNKIKEDIYVNNHVNIVLDYHKHKDDNGWRVVGFSVEPISIAHEFEGGYKWDGESKSGFQKPLKTCDQGPHMTSDYANDFAPQAAEPSNTIIYTYDVIWRESDISWSSRWDIYLTEDNLVPNQVHWYSITNSLLVVIFLSLLIVSIIIRNIRRDIAGYEAMEALTDEEKVEEQEESGWKLIHADVFRSPSSCPMLFAVMIGTGSQLITTSVFSIFLGAIGFVNPARRGSFMTALLVIYMLSGSFAGYVSSRFYKTFQGRTWQLCTLLTATLFPGLCFGLFLTFNTVLAFLRSSGSVPFIDLLIIMAMWCCVSTPLVFMGAFLGYKKAAINFPTRTSSIAREVPAAQNVFLNQHAVSLLAGIIPFAALFVELFFILTSLWMDQYYYVFGFTMIVFFLFLLTCAETTLLLVYYQLCAENHRWWWFSFLTSASPALYMFAYSIMWFSQLNASKIFMTYLIYFGYMFLICVASAMMTGTVGVLTSLWFVKKIFSSVKVD